MTEDWKREKLALLEELLEFMELHQRRFVDGRFAWECPSCYKVDDNTGQTFAHKPGCQDTARRNELRAQIEALRAELGL